MNLIKATLFSLSFLLAAGAAAQTLPDLPGGRPSPFIPLPGGGMAYIHAMREASEWANRGNEAEGSLLEKRAENPLFTIKLNSITGTNAEISIAANPNDPQHLVAAWMNMNYSTMTRGLGTAWSRDGGATWHDSFFAGSGLFSLYDENDPVVVGDDNGTFHLEFLSVYGSLQSSALLLSTSTDGGQSFTTQTTIVKDSGSTSRVTINDKNWMAIDVTNSPWRRNLYSAWLRVNQTTGAQSIVLSRRLKDSIAWSAPKAVNDTSLFPYTGQQTMLQGANVAVGPDGDLYVAWTQIVFKLALPIKATGYLKFDRSTDGGATFGADKTINSHVEVLERYNQSSVYQRMHGFPQIAVDMSSGPRRGRIYICYSAMNGGDADVFLVYSDDKGGSWSAPIRVNNDPVGNGAWQFFGQISVARNGTVSIPYYATQANTSVVDCWIANSWDGGNTFLNNKISDHSFIPVSSGFIGDYIGNVAPAEYGFPAWSDQTSSNVLNVLGAVQQLPTSVPAGLPAPSGIRLAGAYPNPVLRGGEGGATQILFALDRPAPVRLTLVDPLGRFVRRLADDAFLPGSHAVTLHVSNLAQGMYFVLLESPGARQMKKLIVLE